MKKNFLSIMCVLLLLCGCKKDKMVPAVRLHTETPRITTTANTAAVEGSYIYAGTPKSVVIAYGKDSSLSSPQKVTAEHTCDSYSVTINNLESGTTYYFHCIFDTGYGTAESGQWSFTTQSGGEYVDLGLPSGLLWATYNVGADSPEDYGDYFAWGETETKSYYDWDTYKWCNGDYNKLTKYCTGSYYGIVDNKTVLEPADDAAHVKWGGNWRMPTYDEMVELKDNCTWTWTTQGGKNGYRVTGTNGESIFLPAAGDYIGGVLYEAVSRGYYWSSSLGSTNGPSGAIGLLFHSSYVYMGDNPRKIGRPVRPVSAPQVVSVPTVTTSSVSNITQTSAACGGNVTSNGGATVTARGVCWSTSQNPTVSNSHTTDGSGTGSFTSSITGLTASTTYYVRAYATNSAGTSYGEQKSFTTQGGGGGGVIAGHEYVDLGLPSGTLWATCNIGASSPEDYGDYFAWGETTTKNKYNWSTYKWCNGSENTLTKYCTDSSYGIVDNKTVLEPADDAAHVNWGGSWRMPTHDEMKELKDNCAWTWTTQNNVNGYRVTGPNGKSIFLPAAGYCDEMNLISVGSYGDYWSSLLIVTAQDHASDLYFRRSYVYSGLMYRYYGISVRPVSAPQN